MKKENKEAKVMWRVSDDGVKTWDSWSEFYFQDISTDKPKNIKKIRVFLKD